MLFPHPFRVFGFLGRVMSFPSGLLIGNYKWYLADSILLHRHRSNCWIRFSWRAQGALFTKLSRKFFFMFRSVSFDFIWFQFRSMRSMQWNPFNGALSKERGVCFRFNGPVEFHPFRPNDKLEGCEIRQDVKSDDWDSEIWRVPRPIDVIEQVQAFSVAFAERFCRFIRLIGASY